MDDFKPSVLYGARDEFGALLLDYLAPVLMEGFTAIFTDAVATCRQSKEPAKYLLTFQQMLSHIPQWSAATLQKEVERIVQQTKCTYLAEIVMGVHVTHTKLLSSIRAGTRSKIVNHAYPMLDEYVHKCYINVARALYKNVALFEIGIAAVEKQRRMAEFRTLVLEGLCKTVRDNVPVEELLRAYMDESVEEDVREEVKEQVVEPELPPEGVAGMGGGDGDEPPAVAAAAAAAAAATTVTFNDFDQALESDGLERLVSAPKTLERLDEISARGALKRKLDDAIDGGNDADSAFDSFDPATATTQSLGSLDDDAGFNIDIF
jgi:hypothetical protein